MKLLLGIAGFLAALSLATGAVSAATPYAGLSNEANQKPTLPRTVKLVGQGRTISLSPAQLGWTLDNQKIAAAAERKGLPISNRLRLSTGAMQLSAGPGFFDKQVIPAYARLDQATLTRQIAQVADSTQKPAVNARIITRNGDYAISRAKPGRRVDVSGAVAAVGLALADNQTTIDLPVVTVAPAVSEASLQPRLQQLKAERAAALAAAAAAKPAAIPRSCADNPAGRQLILVSISQQHLWACSGPSQAYSTAITSGAYLVGDATPTGTWQIYAKATNVHLIGPTWDDAVRYWMPFYSDYGFHDASWQTFPYGSAAYASQGSHGCVHLPAAAMAWLYGWAPVGTTVTITG